MSVCLCVCVFVRQPVLNNNNTHTQGSRGLAQRWYWPVNLEEGHTESIIHKQGERRKGSISADSIVAIPPQGPPSLHLHPHQPELVLLREQIQCLGPHSDWFGSCWFQRLSFDTPGGLRLPAHHRALMLYEAVRFLWGEMDCWNSQRRIDLDSGEGQTFFQ